MAKFMTGLPKLSQSTAQSGDSTSLYPSILSDIPGGPRCSRTQRKKFRDVTNITAISISKKLRRLVASSCHTAERDYRLSDIRKAMESVIPELMQQQRNVGDTYSQREQEFLSQIVQIGVTFAENGRDLNQVNRQLADIIITLGKVLQGINI